MTIGGGSAGNVLWPLADHLGSVRDLADFDEALGITAIANHITYDAWGQITSETNTAIDEIYGYAGRETDEESHLNFNRARYLDPAAGRWISEDPIGFAAGDTNLASYVGNSPADATDPSGLAAKKDERTDWDKLKNVVKSFAYMFWGGGIVIEPVKSAREGVGAATQVAAEASSGADTQA